LHEKYSHFLTITIYLQCDIISITNKHFIPNFTWKIWFVFLKC